MLNLGVRPAVLIEGAVSALKAAGGAVLERAPLSGVTIFDDGVRLDVRGAPPVTARLVVDATGARGPFVAQARAGQTVDGACLVVDVRACSLARQRRGRRDRGARRHGRAG